MNNELTLTIEEALQWASSELSAQESGKLDAQILLAYVLQESRTYLYTWSEKKIAQQAWFDYQILITKRQQGEPVAYLTGEKEFWSLSLKVAPCTLIPRPETELLVSTVLELSDKTEQNSMRVLDLGTGTGAIALALASEKPTWTIDAADQSLAAVELAKENRESFALQNVEIFQSDWFSAISNKKYHFIVSNPPYIDSHDPHLEQGDVFFEPHSALIADDNGIADLRTIISQGINYLEHEGYLLLEHGYQQAQAVRAIMSEYSYQNIQTIKDVFGNDRVTFGQFFS